MCWWKVFANLKGRRRRTSARADQSSSNVGAGNRAGTASLPLTTIITTSDDEVPDLCSSQQQAQTPLKLLSDDLFIYILMLVICEESDFLEGPPMLDLHDRNTINSVCRHWRWIALNTHSFWTYIPSHLPLDNIQAFLRRSGKAPLHVDIVFDPYLEKPRAFVEDYFNKAYEKSNTMLLKKLDLILQPVHRDKIRSLSLRLSASTIRRIVSAYVGENCRTPALERLCFHTTANADPLCAIGSEKSMMDAKTALFMKFRSTSLNEVHLQGVLIPPDTLPPGSLKILSLTVDRTGGNIVARNARSYIRKLLERGDSLEALSLVTWDANVEGTVLGNEEIVLPQLRHLTLNGRPSHSLIVYQSLSTPLLEQIRLDTGGQTLELINEFVPKTPPGDTVAILVSYWSVGLYFKFTSGPYRTGRFDFKLHSDFDSKHNTNTRLNFILSSHRFQAITTVHLSVSDPFELEFMKHFLEHFESLQFLRLTYTNTRPFSIEDTISLDMLRSPSSPLFYLRSLVFHNFEVKIPQSTPFLVGLGDIAREKGGTDLPLIVEFEECRGVTDDMLRTYGLRS